MNYVNLASYLFAFIICLLVSQGHIFSGVFLFMLFVVGSEIIVWFLDLVFNKR